MITVTDERLQDALDEIKPLTELHWEEIALNKEKIKLNPAYEDYLKLDEMGMLQTVTLRDNGKLVGYCIDFLLKHMHYKDHIFAMNDILFIHPEYRAGTNAIKLLRYTQKCLKSRSVSVHTLHMKVEHSFENLAGFLGYKKIEYNYSKFLGD